MVSFSLVISAQDNFTEGVITTKQTISSDNEMLKSQLSQMGEIVGTNYLNGSKSRVEVSNPMSGDVTVITDADTMKMLTLMDNPMLGKKYMNTSFEVTEEMAKNITIKEGSNTKKVLGYDCKEYIVNVEQGGNKVEMIMFVTEKIKPVLNQQTAMLGDKLK